MHATTDTLLREAVHYHPVRSRRGAAERAFTLWFRGFVYNQIWEDPSVDVEAMQLDSDSRILTISSGGCNVLNYLLQRPQKIVAIDLNTCHMSLTRLKLAAVTHLLSHEDFYNLFGLGNHVELKPRPMTHQDNPTGSDHADHMDRMYRYTRHVYDATRRYYLFGRDRLLRTMVISPGDRVLEMGCGTARNLIKLHRIHPSVLLYGLDASQAMLETARIHLERHGCADGTVLRHCLAEELDHKRTFGAERLFDVIFFSYSLSMMPTWPKALDAALANLIPAGRIYIVDFWDQAQLPRLFAALLKRWLALFQVHYRPELLEHLKQLVNERGFTLDLQPIGNRYAYLATLETGRREPG